VIPELGHYDGPECEGDLSNPLPQWPQWMEEDGVEMLFNRTEMGAYIRIEKDL